MYNKYLKSAFILIWRRRLNGSDRGNMFVVSFHHNHTHYCKSFRLCLVRGWIRVGAGKAAPCVVVACSAFAELYVVPGRAALNHRSIRSNAIGIPIPIRAGCCEIPTAYKRMDTKHRAGLLFWTVITLGWPGFFGTVITRK